MVALKGGSYVEHAPGALQRPAHPAALHAVLHQVVVPLFVPHGGNDDLRYFTRDSSRIPAGASSRLLRTDCAYDVLRGSRSAVQAVDALEESLTRQRSSASIPAGRQRSAAALQVGLRCPAPGLLVPRCAVATAL
jgi:hypothetical protein